jgi:hypothetical protein
MSLGVACGGFACSGCLVARGCRVTILGNGVGILCSIFVRLAGFSLLLDFTLDGVCILGTGLRIGNLLTTGEMSKGLLTTALTCVAVPVVLVWFVVLVSVSEAVPVSSFVCCVCLSNLTTPVYGLTRGRPSLDTSSADGLVTEESLMTGFVLIIGLREGPDEESPDVEELLEESREPLLVLSLDLVDGPEYVLVFENFKAGADKRLAGVSLFRSFMPGGNFNKPQSWKSFGMSLLSFVLIFFSCSGDRDSPIRNRMSCGSSSKRPEYE